MVEKPMQNVNNKLSILGERMKYLSKYCFSIDASKTVHRTYILRFELRFSLFQAKVLKSQKSEALSWKLYGNDTIFRI